jgi:hypothetical protein
VSVSRTDIIFYRENDSDYSDLRKTALLSIMGHSICIFLQHAFTMMGIKLVELANSMYGKCLMVTLSDRGSFELYKLSVDNVDN